MCRLSLLSHEGVTWSGIVNGRAESHYVFGAALTRGQVPLQTALPFPAPKVSVILSETWKRKFFFFKEKSESLRRLLHGANFGCSSRRLQANANRDGIHEAYVPAASREGRGRAQSPVRRDATQVPLSSRFQGREHPFML